MIRFSNTLAISLIGLGCALLPAHADPLQKIGFINTERIYLESKQAQSIQKILEAEFAPRQRELQNLRTQGLALEKQLAGNNLQGEQKDALTRQWRNLIENFRKKQAQFEEDYNLRRNEEFAALQQNANRVIVNLAKKEGFDVILQDVIYVNTKYDVTDSVIKAMND